jgi:hypothetical protein
VADLRAALSSQKAATQTAQGAVETAQRAADGAQLSADNARKIAENALQEARLAKSAEADLWHELEPICFEAPLLGHSYSGTGAPSDFAGAYAKYCQPIHLFPQ